DVRLDHLADPTHRRRGHQPVRQDEARCLLDPEQRVQPVAQRQARLGLQPARELIRPATPHEVELDERAVLVEDDEVDPVEEVPRLEGAAAHASAISSSTDSTGAFGSSTSGPSWGKLTVTVSSRF